MYQQITLIGHLGNDPESRFTPSGVMVASFSVATSRSWVDQSTGERKEKTTWWRVSVWNKAAEPIMQYLRKGSKVLVVGEIEEARAFTDRDGNHRASLEVKAQNVRFLDSKADGDGGQPAQVAKVQAGAPTDTSIEIPF